jgi:ubiquitin-protein ligase
MRARQIRIQSDIENLGQLGRKLGGRLTIARAEGNPTHTLILQANYRTASSQAYPAASIQHWTIKLELPSDYPLSAPKASVDPVLYHPNVWQHGTVCMGSKWTPGEFLDLFVLRLLKTLTFDPVLTNIESPAHKEAAEWYRQRRHDSRLFPSDQIRESNLDNKSTLKWITQ